MEKEQQSTNITYNGNFSEEFGEGLTRGVIGIFSYSFNFCLREPLHMFRDCIPLDTLEDRNKEVIVYITDIFKKHLENYLNDKSKK